MSYKLLLAGNGFFLYLSNRKIPSTLSLRDLRKPAKCRFPAFNSKTPQQALVAIISSDMLNSFEEIHTQSV